MSKVGIYGGTFDPIHMGHLITAELIKEIRKLDKIIFVPAFVAPHKQNERAAPPHERLKMVELAIGGCPYFDCSDFELKRGGISYTIDTIREFKIQNHKIELIIGYDNMLDFHKWKEPDRILELAKVVVLPRQKSDSPRRLNKFFEFVEFVSTPHIELSSTEIRSRIKNNKPIQFLVPDSVKEYIYEQKLYQ